MTFTIPTNVSRVTDLLHQADFEAHLVGGCVRDLLMGRNPKDWDITTNATPEAMLEVFESAGEKVVYENSFGTVAIIFEDEETDSSVRQIEVTPYRVETSYSDNRHPDEVRFAETLEEDLSRRDFTINAFAYNPNTDELVDLFHGKQDLKDGVIRTVGEADERFNEDALRLMRAVRFAAQLGFTLEEKTQSSVKQHAELLKNISWERIRDEFTKLMMSSEPFVGLELMRELGLLEYVSPELMECVGVDQSRNHIYDVWEHIARAGDNAAKQNWPLHVRLASLFHDVGKPRTKRFDKQAGIHTFYGHEVIGARMTEKFMKRMKYPKKLSETVVKLVRYHMFFSDTDQITLSAVRRMIRNVGKDHIWDLMNVRRSDRIGMERPKAAPYRLRMYESMIEEALRDPIDVSMLKMNGDIMIGELGFTPGREIGWILHILLEEVLDDPQKNTDEYLRARTLELKSLDRETLEKLGQKGKETQKEADATAVKQLRKKHHVKFEK